MVDDRIILLDRGLDATTVALLNNNSNWGNNPFMYLIFLMLFGRGWGGFGESNCALTAELSAQMNSNLNTNLIIDGIKGNASAISQLAQNLNCDFNTLNSCCCDLRNAISQVSGQIGFSAERVINAVNMGDCGIVSAIKDCCCNTQKAILESNYQNLLATCQLTNTLTNEMTQGFSGLNFALSNGFAQVGYANAQLTCDLLSAGTANTLRIIDTLNTHWNQELLLKYNDAKLELSQKAQNEYLISQLKTTTTAAA